MFLFECEATFEAEPDAVWKLWTDVTRWPEWDVSKEIARLDGPFEVGSVGWAKQRGNLGGTFIITEIDNGRRWRPVPGSAGPGDVRPQTGVPGRRTGPGGQASRRTAARPR
jgi:hypothetical protein